MGQASSYASSSVARALEKVKAAQIAEEDALLAECGYARPPPLATPIASAASADSKGSTRSLPGGRAKLTSSHGLPPPPNNSGFDPLTSLTPAYYSLDELRMCLQYLPDALWSNLHRVYLLFLLDGDGDGRFSRADIENFLAWAVATVPPPTQSDQIVEVMQACAALHCWERCLAMGQQKQSGTCGITHNACDTAAAAVGNSPLQGRFSSSPRRGGGVGGGGTHTSIYSSAGTTTGSSGKVAEGDAGGSERSHISNDVSIGNSAIPLCYTGSMTVEDKVAAAMHFAQWLLLLVRIQSEARRAEEEQRRRRAKMQRAAAASSKLRERVPNRTLAGHCQAKERKADTDVLSVGARAGVAQEEEVYMKGLLRQLASAPLPPPPLHSASGRSATPLCEETTTPLLHTLEENESCEQDSGSSSGVAVISIKRPTATVAVASSGSRASPQTFSTRTQQQQQQRQQQHQFLRPSSHTKTSGEAKTDHSAAKDVVLTSIRKQAASATAAAGPSTSTKELESHPYEESSECADEEEAVIAEIMMDTPECSARLAEAGLLTAEAIEEVYLDLAVAESYRLPFWSFCRLLNAEAAAEVETALNLTCADATRELSSAAVLEYARYQAALRLISSGVSDGAASGSSGACSLRQRYQQHPVVVVPFMVPHSTVQSFVYCFATAYWDMLENMELRLCR